MTTHYIWDTVSDSYLMETDENGNITAEYITEPVPYGRVISQRRNGATSFYHYDGQGSTRQLTDESGNVTDEYTYSAFGETVASSGTTVNPFGFLGSLGYYANPESGDHYVRARKYWPLIARWLSIDPIGLVRSSNVYTYTLNNPVNWHDASGLDLTDIVNIVDALLDWHCLSEEVRVIAAYQLESARFAASKCFHTLDVLPPSSNMPHQHCLWNCRMTVRMGEEFAEKCSLNKELMDLKVCGIANTVSDVCWNRFSYLTQLKLAGTCCSAWQESDFEDNATGRSCGKCGTRFACAVCCESGGVGPNEPEDYGPYCKARYLEIMRKKETLDAGIDMVIEIWLDEINPF